MFKCCRKLWKFQNSYYFVGYQLLARIASIIINYMSKKKDLGSSKSSLIIIGNWWIENIWYNSSPRQRTYFLWRRRHDAIRKKEAYDLVAISYLLRWIRCLSNLCCKCQCLYCYHFSSLLILLIMLMKTTF